VAVTKRWLSPDEAKRIAEKNREAWRHRDGFKMPPVGSGGTFPIRPPPKIKATAGGRRQGRAVHELPAPSETSECLTFVAWTKLVTFQGEPLFDRVVKIPNERGKSGVQTAILFSIGMRAGFPDYAIHAPAGRWHGLYLEAKRRRGGSVDPEQLAWQSKLKRWGYHCEICAGAEALIEATRCYFERAGCVADGSWVDRTRGPTA
jgi:hypothetical protein